jgi:GntR family transcriptional regulator
MTPAHTLPEISLDRRSFVPLYHQLQDLLRRQIEAGRWQPGDLMPSEIELSRHYRVSRMVVRQAMAILEDEHQVVRHRGRGTFVAEPAVIHRAGGLSRLLGEPRALEVMILDVGHVTVEAPVARRLGIRGKAFGVTARLSLAGTPVGVCRSLFDRKRALWLDGIEAGKPAAAKPQVSMTPASSEVQLEIGSAGELESVSLGVPMGAPMYVVHTVELPRRARAPALETAEIRYRTDVLQCRLEVESASQSPSLVAIFSPAGDGPQ